jgi:hypothetical protein
MFILIFIIKIIMINTLFTILNILFYVKSVQLCRYEDIFLSGSCRSTLQIFL